MTVHENIIFALDGTREEKELSKNVARFSLEGAGKRLSCGALETKAAARRYGCTYPRTARMLLLLDERSPRSTLTSSGESRRHCANPRHAGHLGDPRHHDRDEAFRIAWNPRPSIEGSSRRRRINTELFQITCGDAPHDHRSTPGLPRTSLPLTVWTSTTSGAIDWGCHAPRRRHGDGRAAHRRPRALSCACNRERCGCAPAHIAEVIESTFTYIVMLRFADGAMPIRWEIDESSVARTRSRHRRSLYSTSPSEEPYLLRTKAQKSRTVIRHRSGFLMRFFPTSPPSWYRQCQRALMPRAHA